MTDNVVTVNFRNDTLFAVEQEDGIYVAVKPICESLGLRWHGQFERIKRDCILNSSIRVIRMATPGGARETLCLPLEFINGWLFGVDENRVRNEDVRQKVLAYKRECYQVLFDHFYGRRHEAAPVVEVNDINVPESVRLRQVTEARHAFGVRAAQQLWFQLKLPVVPAMADFDQQPGLFEVTPLRHTTG